MRQDIITQAVPNADPEFIRTMERMPDPPSDAYEGIMAALPKLHEIFLRKRAAAANGDEAAFKTAVDEEVKLIEDANREV